MLTPVERVLILKNADLLKDVGPRHLLGLADVAREIEIAKGETLYDEDDPADALYMVVEGRVRLSSKGDRTTSEVGPGEAFGTWALVDDSRRGHRAECIEEGLALALRREDFYDQAAGDLTLLQEVVRVLAKRLRAMVADRPAEARVEAEGIEKPPEAPTAPNAPAPAAPTAGSALEAAVLGQTETQGPPGEPASSKPGIESD
ncbi:MAG TPA: Crp/Fnr family transcriptional regulator [Patescibacteria group bacterium]|nr:Crp/Fnr family transcriptional regulator [Patescibacteria group bacterium]